MKIIEKRKKLREQVTKKASKWAKKLPFKVTAIPDKKRRTAQKGRKQRITQDNRLHLPKEMGL